MLAVISAPLVWPVAAILQLLFPVLLREQFRAYRWACVALVIDSIILTFHWLLARVWPDWAAVELLSRPETVPHTTWVSVTESPVGPRIDHDTPNVELLETDRGNEFTEMNGWLRALIAFQTFTTPQP